MGQLPLELLSEVAEYLPSDHDRTRCARVCRQWQGVFERSLYRSIRVHSEDFETGNGAVSLSRFQSLTSNAGTARRSMIRTLDYRPVLPYELRDYCTVKEDDECYSEDNEVRQDNDEAFKSGMVALFETLRSWGEGYRMALEVRVLCRDAVLEPGTEEREGVAEFREIRNGRRWVVRPYRARFPNDDASALPYVTCIDQLECEYITNQESYERVWGGAELQIAEHCLGLTRLSLDLDEYVRPDHTDYLRARRRAVAEGLCKLPNSLRVLHFGDGMNEPWQNTLPAHNLLLDDSDILSTNIRDLSMHLRELIVYTTLGLDFLYPLDEEGRPASGTSSLYWPYLEKIEMEDVPIFLPSGEWLFDPTPEDLANLRIPDVDNSDSEDFETLRQIEEEPYDRSVMKVEHFHRLFTSLGYAAQNMPCLKYIGFRMEMNLNYFDLRTDGPDGRVTVRWDSGTGYKPDKHVAEAWGFELEGMDFEERRGIVKSSMSFRHW